MFLPSNPNKCSCCEKKDIKTMKYRQYRLCTKCWNKVTKVRVEQPLLKNMEIILELAREMRRDEIETYS